MSDTDRADTLEELNRFLKLSKDQDDRALVLSLAAFLEDTLGRLLIVYFRDCKATRELVEGFNAPLGTLSARIKAGYSFGLLTEQQFRDLELLRRIRNLFAHDWQGVSLDRNDVLSLTGQLSGYTFSGEKIEGSPRDKVYETLQCCCVELQIFVARIGEGKSPKAPDISFRLTALPPVPRHGPNQLSA